MKRLGIAIGVAFGLTLGAFTSHLLASRNSSGTMSAVNGPYIAGTTISSSQINARFADIESELTDSLSRSGKGGMTAPLRTADGSAAAPAHSFTSDTDTGLYRIGANNIGVALNGTKYLDIATTGTTFVSPLLGPDGALGAPALSMANDTTSGIYRIAGTGLAMSIAGTQRQLWSTTGSTITGTLGVSSDFAINTNKFTVTGSSGNTAIAGTLGVTSDVAVNTNKFTVAGATGNTAIAGTLDVNGSALNTGALTASTFAGPIIGSSTANRGSCTLGTNCAAITVLTGSKCVCTDNTTAAACKTVVSGTTLTITGTGTDVISYLCL